MENGKKRSSIGAITGKGRQASPPENAASDCPANEAEAGIEEKLAEAGYSEAVTLGKTAVPDGE